MPRDFLSWTAAWLNFQSSVTKLSYRIGSRSPNAKDSPSLAFHECLPAGGGSWGSWWWWPRRRPPWTWCSWNKFLEWVGGEREKKTRAELVFGSDSLDSIWWVAQKKLDAKFRFLSCFAKPWDVILLHDTIINYSNCSLIKSCGAKLCAEMRFKDVK